ncbi:MAG: LrgB family protein [Caldimonas sp.]
MSDASLLLLAAPATVLAYALGRRLQALWRSPLATPVFVASALLLALLHGTGASYPVYLAGADPVVALLGPATAALAIPLYKHRATLCAVLLPALSAIVSGALATMATALVLALVLHLPGVIVASIAIKSVTAPIAAELAPLLHGDATMAVTFAVATGIAGAVAGPLLLGLARVSSPLARGLAYGTISTGIGTSRALAESDLAGAAAAMAMSIAGVVVAVTAPFVVPSVVAAFRVLTA